MDIKNNPVTNYFKEIVKPLGLVYGDIGTSPIYTLTIVFLLLQVTSPINIMGVISLVFWTLILLVTIQYAWLAMSLGKDGEGGTIVLREILIKHLKSAKAKDIFTYLTFFGVSLFIGNNIITPAISILSAVEGIVLIPGLEELPLYSLLGIACLITILLFAIQNHGTDKVSVMFGPIMFLWFGSLALAGIISIIQAPEILKALSPIYALDFLLHHGYQGFLVLSLVFLCATGGEVLYADMGHLGKEPIIKGWYFTFIALMLNYLGQGAFLLTHPNTKTVLFEMIFNQAKFLYVPFLILTILATVIASQATISGMFSIVYQGITTRIMPLLKIDYTSPELRSQIYIDSVNWFLMVMVLLLIVGFQHSSLLGIAYGLAVSGTMTLTVIMMIVIFYLIKDKLKFGVAIFILLVDVVFLASNALKIPQGGYWSVVIALIPLTIILIYNLGQKRLYRSLKPIPLKSFLPEFIDHYKNHERIQGTALYFARDIDWVPPYIFRTMLRNRVVYDDNIVISIITIDESHGIEYKFKEPITDGLRVFEIRAGYMELLDISKILKEANIDVVVIFYGVEDIVTDNFWWRIFALIKAITPSFVKFYKLPSNKIHGVISQINM